MTGRGVTERALMEAVDMEAEWGWETEGGVKTRRKNRGGIYREVKMTNVALGEVREQRGGNRGGETQQGQEAGS